MESTPCCDKTCGHWLDSGVTGDCGAGKQSPVGDSHMKGTGMLSELVNLISKEDQSRSGSSFI